MKDIENVEKIQDHLPSTDIHDVHSLKPVYDFLL